MSRAEHGIIGTLVLLAALWQFSAVSQAGFIHQDNRWAGWYEGLAGQGLTPPASTVGQPRSLMQWSWYVQASSGQSARAFHLVNLALHGWATLLVALLVVRLGGSALAMWIAVIVFLLNPIQHEAVLYIAGRTELFAVIGVLTACLLMMDELTTWRVLAAGLALWFGIAGKESAVLTLALVPVVRREWAAAIIAIELLVVIVYSQAQGMHLQVTSWAWASTQIAAGWRMVWTAITLTGGTVQAEYRTWGIVARGLALVGLLGIGAAGWRVKDTEPMIAVGSLWLLAAIAQRVVVETPTSVFNEHQFYGAMPGMALIVAGIVTALERRRQRLAWSVA